nr:MAG TPA: hypothetical protein [Caudoviricetes sp.]
MYLCSWYFLVPTAKVIQNALLANSGTLFCFTWT